MSVNKTYPTSGTATYPLPETVPSPDHAEMAELLPCPFCGSTNVHLHGAIDYDGRWAMCSSCCCTLSEVDVLNDAEAIARWNRRAPSESSPAEPCPRMQCDHLRQQLATAERTIAELKDKCLRLVAENDLLRARTADQITNRGG